MQQVPVGLSAIAPTVARLGVGGMRKAGESVGRGRGETQLTYLCGSRVLASLGLRGWAGSLGKARPWRVLSRPHPTPHTLSPAPFLGPCGAGVYVSPAQLRGHFGEPG